MRLKDVKNIRLGGQSVLSIKYDGQYIWRKGGADEYTTLEYLDSNGYQYINTGIYPNNTTVIDIDVMNLGTSTASSTGNYFAVCGNYSSTYASTATIHMTAIVSAAANMRYGSYNSSIALSSPRFDIGDRSLVHIENGLYKYKDTVIKSFTPVGTFTGKDPLLVYKSGTSTAIRRLRIYSFKIQQNNKVIFDGIPVVRNSDGELGFLNKVTNEFFTNAGTGTFTPPSKNRMVEDLFYDEIEEYDTSLADANLMID